MKKLTKKNSRVVSLTEGDFSRIAGIFDKRFVPLEKDISDLKSKVSNIEINMATKKDLVLLRHELQGYVHEGVDAIMKELDRIENIIVAKEEMVKLKLWATKVGEKIGVTL